MDLKTMGVFSLASKRMDWLGSRQQVTAENVANADTPGYKARDVESFDSYLDAGKRSTGMRTTDPMHISGRRGSAGADTKEDKDAWGMSPDGNTVVLEQQSIKSAETAEQYKLVTSLYKKSFGLLKVAASGGR